MRILNFGSLNIDHVYQVEHFVRPGETLNSAGYARYGGGKGSNQSIALAYAGARVSHAGKLGADGVWLRDRLQRAGVDVTGVEIVDGPSGHAIIQVNREGENAIILHGGANRRITGADAERVMAQFSAGDYLLLQNEISSLSDIMRQGADRGLHIVFNPAPMDRDVAKLPLRLVRCFIVNEIEGGELTGRRQPEDILAAMRELYPSAATVLTRGEEGVSYADAGTALHVPAVKVKAVDTTAAGDTFIGYFLADIVNGRSTEAALRMACQAAAVCVTRPGASDSIPRRNELE